MYKDVLRSIEGAEIFPMIALILFFLLFLGITIWAFKRDKKTIDEIAHMPLDDSDNTTMKMKV